MPLGCVTHIASLGHVCVRQHICMFSLWREEGYGGVREGVRGGGYGGGGTGDTGGEGTGG